MPVYYGGDGSGEGAGSVVFVAWVVEFPHVAFVAYEATKATLGDLCL